MPKQTKNDKLFQSLQALCKKAIDKVVLYKEQGKLEVITYQHLPVNDIDYLMETYHYDWDKLNYFDFYEWRSKDFVSFIETELCTLVEFEEAAKQIMDEFKVPENAVKRIGLFSLLRLIMKQVPNRQITYENIDDYIQLFIDDYESYRSNIPTNWNIDLWLNNIYIESDEIEIASNVFLRRPTKEQLADVKPKPNHISEFDRMTGRGLIAGAVLSFTIPAGQRPVIGLYPDKITTQIEKWLNIFRLLKPTDITVVYQSVAPVSIFEHPVSENKDKPQDNFWRGKVEHKDTSSFKLYLKKDEEELLKVFIKNLNSALKGFSHTSYLTGNSYDLAFHRYNDSLLKTEVNAYKILSSITSLEALLSDGSTEITFKIRLRVSKLLSYFGFNALDVSNKIRDAYNLRSKLVHGAKPEAKKKDLLEFARQHTHEILNFNRICLLVALQLKQKTDKQKLIKQIDSSFIDKISDENLKKLIDENVKIPIINPFRQVEKK
ncbi:MAG: hypothetical protein K8R74_14130 [Bacteroidales bacterium]|nr:hypothetical protein [Bacteroidales bacterium]